MLYRTWAITYPVLKYSQLLLITSFRKPSELKINYDFHVKYRVVISAMFVASRVIVAVVIILRLSVERRHEGFMYFYS